MMETPSFKNQRRRIPKIQAGIYVYLYPCFYLPIYLSLLVCMVVRIIAVRKFW